MNDNGWVKFHRQLCSNDLWLREKFSKAQAWVDLFVNANHKDGGFWVRGTEVKVKRGQLAWSELTMASRWRWSRMKVRRFLNDLEMRGQIVQQSKHKITSIVDIINYDKFQSETSDETTERQQKDNRRDTNKNVKNVKNVKNTIAAPKGAAEESPPIPTQPILFSFKEEVKKMEDHTRRDLNVIALYFEKRNPDIRTREQFQVALKRHIRPAKSLTVFTDNQILKACDIAEKEYPKVWTIETLIKILTK